MGYRRMSARVSWGRTTAHTDMLLQVMELAPLGSLHARLTAPAPTPPLGSL